MHKLGDEHRSTHREFRIEQQEIGKRLHDVNSNVEVLCAEANERKAAEEAVSTCTLPIYLVIDSFTHTAQIDNVEKYCRGCTKRTIIRTTNMRAISDNRAQPRGSLKESSSNNGERHRGRCCGCMESVSIPWLAPRRCRSPLMQSFNSWSGEDNIDVGTPNPTLMLPIH